MDTSTIKVKYGRVNAPLIQSWFQLQPEDDAPFWALNLMKYRETAEYADGRAETRSGREADDEYAPVESLAAVGAKIVLVGNVVAVPVGDGVRWDRVAVVRYPRRRAILEMQQREEFQQSHVHKEAGMEFTIVMATHPVLPLEAASGRRGLLELRVAKDPGAAAGGPGPSADFSVEGDPRGRAHLECGILPLAAGRRGAAGRLSAGDGRP